MNAPFTPNAGAVLEGYALSPQQSRQWRWQQERGTASVADAELVLRIDGAADLPRLRAGLAQVFARHEILRTGFSQLPGMATPVQVVAAEAAPSWLETDQDGYGMQVQEHGPARTLLRLRMPARQADAASLVILAAEWQAAYAGMPAAQEPLQYADYAAWRLELPPVAVEGHPLWQNDIAAPSALPLRPQTGTGTAACTHGFVPLAMEGALQQRWHAAASALGVAPQHVLLAAFAMLQHQHSGAARLTLGYDWQQRSTATASAIGLYGEALPLTLDGLDDLDFQSLCRTLAHQGALLDQWRDGCPETLLAAPYSLAFRCVAPAAPALATAGWHIELASAPAAPVQLMLEMGPAGLGWHFNRELYDAAALEILTGQLTTLLDNACRTPSTRLAKLSACSEAERDLLAGPLGRGTAASVAQDAQYHAVANLPNLAVLFERQGVLHPQRCAVSAASGRLTYAELARRSAVLARHLTSAGLTPGARVAHLLPRDADAVVAMLAIFLAGACYVPVDPSYPAQRIAFILGDSDAQAVLTHSSLLGQLPEAARARAIAIDLLPTLAPTTPTALRHAGRDDAAYMIYTSGSTGQPKGVPITHANALHSLAARIAYYPRTVQRYLLLSSFAFDSSIAGLFWSLAQGGALHICSEDQQKDPVQIAQVLRDEAISHVLALPTLYAHVLEAAGAPLAALGTVIVAGEACPPQLVQAHLDRQPQATLYNEYGPTEASVWSTVAECGAPVLQSPVPIGRPIPYSSVYVLDTQGAPAARGIPGEIHIGGPGLSPGYTGRPELTVAKFITATHPALAGQRLYRSGDLALVDQHGELVFLGRADAQVKVRGYRIEPGEIESALCAASGAAVAIVLTGRSDEGDVQLRAYVEAAGPLDGAALREALARHLPDYMVPADIQVLAALPRTPNGKIDNSALLAIRPTRRCQPYQAPRNPVEAALAAMWCELLGGDPPGIDDDFFALGGHSLLVVRLVHLIKAAFGRQLRVAAVFAAPTIRALSQQLADDGNADCLQQLRAGVASQAPLFLLHRPAGDVQHYGPLLAALPASQPVYGVLLPAGCTPHQATLAELAQRYCDAIRRLQPQGPYYLCGWSMGGLLALELAALLEQSGQRVALLGIVDSSVASVDHPMSAAQLLRYAERELDAPSRQRLGSMPAARAEVQQLSSGQGKFEQLQTLYDWAQRHELALQAPQEVVLATLTAWAHARQWVAGFAARPVQTELHLWCAQDTLATQPGVPAYWSALCPGAVCHAAIPGDHDDILAQPQFLHGFTAALAQAQEQYA